MYVRTYVVAGDPVSCWCAPYLPVSYTPSVSLLQALATSESIHLTPSTTRLLLHEQNIIICTQLEHSLPFCQDNVIAFYNHTIVGSRFIANYYYFRAPAPESFCQIPFEPPLLNAQPGSECGVNGKHADLALLSQYIPYPTAVNVFT